MLENFNPEKGNKLVIKSSLLDESERAEAKEYIDKDESAKVLFDHYFQLCTSHLEQLKDRDVKIEKLTAQIKELKNA